MGRDRFLLITMDLKKQPDGSVLRDSFEQAADWIQFFPNQWLIWTSSPPAIWYGRLKRILKSGDHILIVEIDAKRRAGLMPSTVWDFIKKRTMVLD